MLKLEVFDPAMCCSTGVCGPQVDPRLATFEADLRWLGAQGADVTRHNLGSEPGAFAGSEVVRTILQSGGEDVLPVVLVDGRLRWTGHYPTRDELAATLPSTGATVTDAPVTDAADDACCAPAGDACCAPSTAPPLQVVTAPSAGACSPDSGCC